MDKWTERLEKFFDFLDRNLFKILIGIFVVGALIEGVFVFLR